MLSSMHLGYVSWAGDRQIEICQCAKCSTHEVPTVVSLILDGCVPGEPSPVHSEDPRVSIIKVGECPQHSWCHNQIWTACEEFRIYRWTVALRCMYQHYMTKRTAFQPLVSGRGTSTASSLPNNNQPPTLMTGKRQTVSILVSASIPDMWLA